MEIEVQFDMNQEYFEMKFDLLMMSVLLHSSICKPIRIYDTPEGIIRETTVKEYDQPYNITFSIEKQEDRITTVRLLQLAFTACNDAEKCCHKNYLLINGNGKRYKFCNISRTSEWLSLSSSRIEILLQIEKGNANFWLEYKSRSATECPNHEFQCKDKTFCYNSSQICDHQFACKDHSDDLGCSYCARHLAPCDTWSEICFDPTRQRCDNTLDCPRGEDEQGCSENCNSTTIGCISTAECISPHQLCDNKNDCSNGFDEENCAKQYCKSPPYFLCNNGMCIEETLVGNGIDDCGDISDEMNFFQLIKTCAMAILIVFLSILFTSLVVRWCSRRRDIHRLLQNLPEFPLPPFQGPGEHGPQESYNLGYSDSDFRVGGDVYEAFARFRRRIDTDNKNNENNVATSRTHSGCVNFNSRSTDGDLEIIEALVSLSLPHKMCIGLDSYIVEMMENYSAVSYRSQSKEILAKSRRKNLYNFGEFLLSIE